MVSCGSSSTMMMSQMVRSAADVVLGNTQKSDGLKWASIVTTCLILVLTAKQWGINIFNSRSSSTAEQISHLVLSCDHLMVSSWTLLLDLIHVISSVLIFKFARGALLWSECTNSHEFVCSGKIEIMRVYVEAFEWESMILHKSELVANRDTIKSCIVWMIACWRDWTVDEKYTSASLSCCGVRKRNSDWMMRTAHAEASLYVMLALAIVVAYVRLTEYSSRPAKEW
jgi:hypothetical protein